VRLPKAFRVFPPETMFENRLDRVRATAKEWAFSARNNIGSYNIKIIEANEKNKYQITIWNMLSGQSFVSDPIPQIKDNHDWDTNNPVANTFNCSGRAFWRIGIEGRKIYEIRSTPGDNRQYVFIVFQDDGYRFFFIGLNGFKYPSVLQLKRFDYTDFEISLLACQTNCETATVKECIRTAEIIRKEHR